MTTTNPVPSNDPTDLLFNAQKLDQVVNGTSSYYTDRLGVNRRTVEGINAAADVVLGGLGYAPPVAYASGISLTLTTQTVEYSGEVYAPKLANIPFTTTTWATDSAKFRLIQGVSATDLAASGGSAMVGYTPAGTGAVATTVQSKLRETVSVADHGGQAGVDCAAELISAGAATSGSVLIPAGAWTATATTTNSDDILALLNRIRCDGNLTINLDAGTHNFTSQVVINSPDAQRIQILGASTLSTTATSQVSVSGSAKAYSVTIGVSSSAGAVAGDYALIRTDVAGTGDFYAHAGVWKITAVDSGGANRLTLLNTHHGVAFPTNTITGGSVRIIKTVLKFSGCDGFRFEGGQPLGLINRLAIVGDWDVFAGTGTAGAHGIITSSPNIIGGASSNSVFNMTGSVTVGETVGVSAWGEQGIALSGRDSMVANFVAACSNRKRGIYSEGSSLRCKYATCSGNGEDGFIADTTGFIQAAYAIASGNGLNGFWSTNNSLLAASNAKASSNLTSGFESRGDGRLAADAAISIKNGIYGFSASDGGMIDSDSAIADGNGSDGFYGSQGAVIDANNASSKNNGGWGVNGSNCELNFSGSGTFTGNTSGAFNLLAIGIRGYINNAKFPFILGEVAGTTNGAALRAGHDATKYVDFVATSTGDLVIQNNGTSSFVAKAQGAFYPSLDNDSAQTCGRATQRWSTIYAGTGAINTSDAREKQDIATLDAAEMHVAVAIKGLIRKYRFKDAVQSKGAAARIHVGVIAQEVVAAFQAEGLDPMRYGIVCYDEWEYEEGVLPGNRYGVRYEELLAFIIAAL